MSRSSSTAVASSSGGIGFAGLLTVALVVLKLTGYIDWSWWWVFSPIWIGFLVVIFISLVFVTIAVLAAILTD